MAALAERTAPSAAAAADHKASRLDLLIDQFAAMLSVVPPAGTASTGARPTAGGSTQQKGAAAALVDLLWDLDTLVRRLSRDVYGAPFRTGASGSVGQHVRHCLDHIAALVRAAPGATLTYDHRERGTSVEHDPAIACHAIQTLAREVWQWSRRPLDEPVRVHAVLSRGGQPVVAASTLARELAFVVNHTIHHQALIAVVLACHGVAVPDGFGYAPSTPRPDRSPQPADA